jgi:hypothetical protein
MNIKWFCFIILQSTDLLRIDCKIIEVNGSEVSWGEQKIFKCHARESFKECDGIVSWLMYTVCIFERYL